MEREKLVALVTAAQSGDGTAMNDLFNAFYNDVYYFALKTVKDDQTACDVTQETFIEIINTLGKLQEPAAFVTWMKQITYHQCTRYFKKKKDVIVDEDEDGNTVFDTLQEEKAEFIPDEALDKEDFRQTVMTFVDELSEEQRAAVMMFYFDEMSIKDIAEAQNVSENTVKSRLNYARKGIKKSVEDYEKKTGVKLYGVGVLPLLVWLFKGVFAEAMSPAAAGAVAGGISAATGTTVVASATAATAAAASAAAVTTAATASAATASAASASAAAAVGIGAKLAAIPLVAKIIAVATAVAVAGGTTAAVVMTGGDEPADHGEGDKGIVQAQTTIPEGMTYTLSDGTVLEAGDKFPAQCTPGDKVDYGDYYYGYECIYVKNQPDSDDLDSDWLMCTDFYSTTTGGDKYIPADSGVIEEDIFGCWLPMVKDIGKTAYGDPLPVINGKKIGALYATYMGCEKMEVAPKIPQTVTSLSMAYNGCKALKSAPIIPRSVRRLMGTFYNCSSLSGDIVFNGKLDGKIPTYDTLFGVTGNINLTGEATLEDWRNVAMYAMKGGTIVRLRGALFGSDEAFAEPAEGEHYHEFAENILKKATCLEGGQKQYVCKICDATYVDPTSKSSHTWDGEYVEPMVGKPIPPVRHCTVCGVAEEPPGEYAALNNAFGDHSLGLIFENMYYLYDMEDMEGFVINPNAYTANNIWHYMNIELARDAHQYETTVSAEEFFAEVNKRFVLTEKIKEELKQPHHSYDAATDSFTYCYDGEAHGFYGPLGYIHDGGNRYTVYFEYGQGIDDGEPVNYWKIELEYNRLEDLPNRYLAITYVSELPNGLSTR